MVPNCAYTCNTCLIGVSNNNGVQHNAGILGCFNSQQECAIVTRENSDTVRDGIIREAAAVLTTTVENTDAAATEASLTAQGIIAGKETLKIVAEAVRSSAREYAMGCRDMSTMCRTMMLQGQCQSNSSFMFVNCPISCDSCLPTERSECVDKGDKDLCELSAALGLCEINYSYNLRFCSGSCKTTQSIMNRCTSARGSSQCSRKKSLRNPDFKCGVPLNRRKRLAVSIMPAQSRGAKRLQKHSTRNREKNNKRKRKINQTMDKLEERIKNTSTSVKPSDIHLSTSTVNATSRQQLEGTSVTPSKKDLNTSALNATSRQQVQIEVVEFTPNMTQCCQLIIPIMPQGRQETGCTADHCDSVCSTTFNCLCCTVTRDGPVDPNPQGPLVPIWALAGLGGLLAGAAGMQLAPVAPSSAAVANPIPVIANVAVGVTPIFPIVALTPLIIATVIAAVPPQMALSSISSIPDTIATRRAAMSLLPFCDANGYLDLLKQLSPLIISNTGKPLNPQVVEITDAIAYCRHGVGRLPPSLVTNITTETGFGNVSNIAVQPPSNYPGVSVPGLGENSEALSGIAALGAEGEITNNDRNRFFCGASLITNRHILTAAHCVVNINRRPEVIRLGERDFTTSEDGISSDYNIKKITRHPGYKLLSSVNDIAVIELEDEVTVERSGNLLPYCLPSEIQNLDGLNCTVSGWGTRPNTQASTVLLNPIVTVRSLEECREAYQENAVFRLTHPRGIDETSLCAGGETVCRGDSGGPLVLRSEGREEEVGIVSQGVGCGNPDFPGIYTRTDSFLDWLDEVVYGEDNEICP